MACCCSFQLPAAAAGTATPFLDALQRQASDFRLLLRKILDHARSFSEKQHCA
jgi:hypothetical protein